MVGTVLAKNEKDPGWNIESFILFNFCVTFVHLSLSDLYFSLYLFALIFPLLSCVCRYVHYKAGLLFFVWLQSLFPFWHFGCHKWKQKKNTNNNSHALRQKENPKTKHFHHWCIKMRKEASLYLRICCCF